MLKKNDHFHVKITDMGMNGEGIGKWQDVTFFIKDAVVGDEIEAAVTKMKKHYGYGRVVRIEKPSPFRVEPRCPVAKACGGCQMQAVAYGKQLELKQRRVTENLRRIGGFSPELLEWITEPIVGMEEPFRYRNKAQFPVGCDRDGNTVMGFYAARSHRIVPVEDCVVGIEENGEILALIRKYMVQCNVEPYDEETGRGLIRHILIRKGFSSGQIMVCLVVNGTFLPDVDVLCDLLRQVPGMTGISLNVNTRRTNVILGSETKVLWGQARIRDSIRRVREVCGEADGAVSGAPAETRFVPVGQEVTFEISPRSFYQVNPRQTEKLYSIALDYAGLDGGEVVWDLYCGIGTISLFLAQKAKQVYGVEIVPPAIEDAKRNAKLNGITNAEFFVGKAEEVLPEKYEQEGIQADVIVVDPPRKGCDEAVLQTMLKMQPEKIVYVSCDSATLARDLKILCEKEYRLEKVAVCDMFPQGVHVESIVLLSKLKSDKHIDVEL